MTVELLTFQPWGSNVSFFHPHSEIQDWDFVTKLWMTRWTIIFSLNVLDDIVCNLLHLFHGDLVLFFTNLILDFVGSLLNKSSSLWAELILPSDSSRN